LFWTTSRSQPGIFEPTILASGCIPRGHLSPRPHSRSKARHSSGHLQSLASTLRRCWSHGSPSWLVMTT
jgi:hypothetical protein